MKLLQVVLQMDYPEMDVWMWDDLGNVERPVKLWVQVKENPEFPPAGWVTLVNNEIDYNRAQEGRTLIP